MPSKRAPGGDFRDIAQPISAALRSHMQQAVLDAYEAELQARLLQPCTDGKAPKLANSADDIGIINNLIT